VEPYVLFMSGKFINKMKKAFKIGTLARKPFKDVATVLGYSPVEISSKEAKEYFDRLAPSLKDLARGIIQAFFIPAGLLSRKNYITQEILDIGDFSLLHFATFVGRMVKKTYFGCIVLPKSESGLESSKNFFKTILSKVGQNPIDDKGWKDTLPAREKFIAEKIKGSDRNLWPEIAS